jgi:DNA-binding LacI/PurR family transcriptional regulator
MDITAKDIAKKLGVSPSAVSLAMNGKPGVSVATREKVLAEAVRMGYTIARKPAAAETLNIRYVIFLEGGAAVKETSFYSIVLQGIEAFAKEKGYNVLISYFYAGGDWTEQIAAVTKDVAGLIILATEVEDRHIAKALSYGLDKQNIPIVLVDNATSLVDVDCVVADNLRGAFHAVTYLLENGHPDVGYLRSRDRIDSFDERQIGFLKARREFGISDANKPQTIDVGIASEQAFYDMCAWLNQGGKPLSAFFADNDIIAAACIRALKTNGYRVPEDVSIVGFDDMPVCTMIDPTLTTVRVMKEQMGMTAMEILYKRIHEREQNREKDSLGVMRITISTRLVERESTIPYRKTVEYSAAAQFRVE